MLVLSWLSFSLIMFFLLSGVTIKVSKINKSIKVRHPNGYYWRPLVEGTYKVTASKHGYYSLSRRCLLVFTFLSDNEPFFRLRCRESLSKFKLFSWIWTGTSYSLLKGIRYKIIFVDYINLMITITIEALQQYPGEEERVNRSSIHLDI